MIVGVLFWGGLSPLGCLPTDDLGEYSESWSPGFGGAGGNAAGAGPEASGGAAPDASPGVPPDAADGGAADGGQSGGGSGVNPLASGGADAALDAGGPDSTDATDAGALAPDACADAASPGC